MARRKTFAGSIVRITRNLLIALFVLAAAVGGLVGAVTILVTK